MKGKKMFRTIETHTLGQPTRNVVSGFPVIPGSTMEEKYEYMREHADWLRTLLCCEPRGSDIMSATIFTEPCTPGTDIGVLYFEVSGWMPMCGHDTIGATVALIESGMVDVTEPVTKINLDTAAGVVNVEAVVRDGVVEKVSFLNAPAMVLNPDAVIKTKEWGDLKIDVSWGGNVYALLPAESVGLEIKPENASELIHTAQIIGKYANEQLKIKHPTLDFVDRVSHVEFYGAPKSPDADIQNCVVALPITIDRSPCGTGTSAKCALLYHNGELKEGDSFVHESIIGSQFTCKLEEVTEVGGVPAVRPLISGNAVITGFATWILDPKDPFQKGFSLS